MRIAAVVALLGSALALAAPGSTVNRPPSLLLFNAPPEVETAFGVVRANGKGRRVLSHEYSARAWSPSGRRILAYGGPTGLAILDDRGLFLRTLPTAGRFLYEAAWSPNGKAVAGFSDRCTPPRFCADPPHSANIVIVSLDGRTVTSEPFRNGAEPSWAPQGDRLAFSRGVRSTRRVATGAA